MRTAGIICEYNPFHAGHKKQIDILHGMGYDCVVCVMSGNYTQRGELAIFDKYTRAKSAVLGGADLVLELPFPFSSFSAEGFANSGVHILASLGVDAICFGSECADTALLETAANTIISDNFPKIYSELIKSGLGSASAYFEAIKTISGKDISLFSNDILAISYIASVKKSRCHLDIIPIRRDGAAYNEKKLIDGILPSASAIRESIKNNSLDLHTLLDGKVPDISLNCLVSAKSQWLAPVLIERSGAEILSFFKIMYPNEIIYRANSRSNGGIGIAEDGCGICERLCNTARTSKTYDEFVKSSYTSKYTDARINRIILFSLFGVADTVFHSLPTYTTLLAANKFGCEFLSEIRKKNTFPIVTKPADAPEDTVQRRFSDTSDAFYSRAFPTSQNEDFFIKSRPFILK